MIEKVFILAERGIKYLSAAPDFIMSYPLEIERPERFYRDVYLGVAVATGEQLDQSIVW